MKIRLKQAREAAGFRTAADAARRFGWAESTYQAHENGSRNISRDKILKYAKAFSVPPEWILSGGPLPAEPKLGFIMVGGLIMINRQVVFASSPDFKETVKTIEFPYDLPAGHVAFLVKTADLSPAYEDGDVLICSTTGDIRGCERCDCVIELEDGERSFRRVSVAASGVIVLEGPPLPPVVNPLVKRAHPVEWVRKNFAKR